LPNNKAAILCAEEILGPNIGSLKAKMTRKLSRVQRHALDDLPEELLEKHKNVTYAVDIMYLKLYHL